MSPRHWLRLAAGVTFLHAACTVRAELVLADFSPANPIKIMAAGDSITDDCVVNGAWRLYLQPLLEADGYPFAFVGRAASAPSGGFTQVQHEGYCGSVLAAPGVLTYAVHGYAGVDVYLQKIISDELTNVTPDLLLVFIGVNDIGRARVPQQVGTNDIPAFLDMVFSKAPNANVILAKITTLQDAALGYNVNFLNVPVYNAALQSVVNQRRALGQKVFLADLFSAVDYATMFNSDHLHPNALGLQAIAKEWLTRIRAMTITTNRVVSTLIRGGDVWKYSDTGVDLGTNWTRPDYDDSGWSNGTARLGYGLRGVVTTNGYGGVPANKYVTTYFRHSIVVPDDVAFTNLNFRLSAVHGAVVWLNGQEAYRLNMPAGGVAFTNLSLSGLFGMAPYIFQQTNLTAATLTAGTNVVAVEVHLNSTNTSSMGFDMELLATGVPAPQPSVSITVSNNSCLLTWPESNATGYTLHSSTNLNAPAWPEESGPFQTNAGQVSATLPFDAKEKYYRLQRTP